MLVSRVNQRFAQSIDFIDDVVLYRKGLRGGLATMSQLRGLNVTLSISCFIDIKLGLILLFSGIAKRVAPATKLAQIFFNLRVSQRRSRVEKPEWAYNLDLGRSVFPGLPSEFNIPLLTVPKMAVAESAAGNIVLNHAGKKLAIFHPGFGGSSDGNLSLSQYVSLALSASRLPNVRAIFSFGPDDAEIHDEFLRLSRTKGLDADVLNGSLSLWEYCGFLQFCEVLVSTSTGPMHLAGAVNCKTISFFGATAFASSKRWQSLNQTKRQANFMLSGPLSETDYQQIETSLHSFLL